MKLLIGQNELFQAHSFKTINVEFIVRNECLSGANGAARDGEKKEDGSPVFLISKMKTASSAL